MNIKSIKLKKYADKNGSLIPIYLNKLSKFKIKRLFILDGKINTIRGPGKQNLNLRDFIHQNYNSHSYRARKIETVK